MMMDIPTRLAVSMDVPPIIDGFSYMATSYRPELLSSTVAPDMGESMLVATALALTTALLSAGLVLASDQQNAKKLDGAMADVCFLVEMPDLSLVDPEKDWWLCPGATLEDAGDCQAVYYDGETQIVCAF